MNALNLKFTCCIWGSFDTSKYQKLLTVRTVLLWLFKFYGVYQLSSYFSFCNLCSNPFTHLSASPAHLAFLAFFPSYLLPPLQHYTLSPTYTPHPCPLSSVSPCQWYYWSWHLCDDKNSPFIIAERSLCVDGGFFVYGQTVVCVNVFVHERPGEPVRVSLHVCHSLHCVEVAVPDWLDPLVSVPTSHQPSFTLTAGLWKCMPPCL